MLIMKGLLGFLLLLPTIFAYMLHLSLLILVFSLPMRVSDLCSEKGGLYRLLGALVSVIVGGISIRLGYWFGIEGFTAWELRGHQVMYPIIGWIYMVVGGLIAVIGIWWAIKGESYGR
jgi:hypothetical protein